MAVSEVGMYSRGGGVLKWLNTSVSDSCSSRAAVWGGGFRGVAAVPYCDNRESYSIQYPDANHQFTVPEFLLPVHTTHFRVRFSS